MIRRNIAKLSFLLLIGCISPAELIAKKNTATPKELNDQGKQIEAELLAEMTHLKKKIQSSLASINDNHKKSYQAALQAEKSALEELKNAQSTIGSINRAQAAVNHAKGKWIRNAERGIKQAEKHLKESKNITQRNTALKQLEKWKKNLADGKTALAERTIALNNAKKLEKNSPKLIKTATDKLTKAKLHTKKTFIQSGFSKIITHGTIDPPLVKYIVLMESTPKGLASFAQKSPKNHQLVKSLLSDTDLMRDMLTADGAKKIKLGRNTHSAAQYGPAMEIYANIIKQMPNSNDKVLRELAIAIALEHSVPIIQVNPINDKSSETHINPVKRFLYFANAYLNKDLDPAFANLNAWELRMVVDGSEPNHILTWGRNMLRNYQPAHITTPDYGWRYVRIVASDVKYGSGDVKYDRPELQSFQNIMMNGGICGRRAFFGRFILRAFGIPTAARPSKGHAALTHWTPKAWVVNLGPGWGRGWTSGPYKKDRNFLASSQARYDRIKYPTVKRAMWLGDVMDEKRVYGEHGQEKPGFWGNLSLQLQRDIIENSNAKELAALGAEIGESNAAPKGPDTVTESTVTDNDKKITYKNDIITIPAAAFDKNPGRNKVLKSYHKGLQINMGRFTPKGLTVLRTISSGARIKSGGYGRYNDWGFRVAMTPTEGSKTPKEITIDLGKGINMDLVYIKPGTFTMGGESTKDGRFQCIELPKHKVTLTKGYYLGKYEVTQAQLQAITSSNPSITSKKPNFPAINISEQDALKFCELASEKTTKIIRLPSEAEWEYAARAGTNTKYFFGNSDTNLNEYAWTKTNSKEKTNPVGQKKPNPWGLYDIYGNALERVADRYDKNYYKQGDKIDPTGPSIQKQSHLSYTVNAIKPGKYHFHANVVTNNYGQHLMVSINGNTPNNLTLPFTKGNWTNTTQKITLELKKGINTLDIFRRLPPQAGIAVKSFTLSPLKSK